MVPYVEWNFISLGPLTIQVWGLFVVFGFLVGIILARWKLRQHNYAEHQSDVHYMWDLGAWIIIGALVGARLGHVFFYAWPYFSQHIYEILNVWDGGMASYGGFMGGIVALSVYARTHALNFWDIAEAVAWSVPFGMITGRVGCALIHDHPGKLTSSFFGVQYPEGARFDLGLLEILALIPLAVTFFILRRKKYTKPIFMVATFLYYGIARFFLDFLRVAGVIGADARYAGLTPAQYGSILLVFIAIVLIKKKFYYKMYLKQ